MLNDNNLQNEFLGRAGERRVVFPGIPLSPTLSPLVPRGEREKICVRGLTNSTAVLPDPPPDGGVGRGRRFAFATLPDSTGVGARPGSKSVRGTPASSGLS